MSQCTGIVATSKMVEGCLAGGEFATLHQGEGLSQLIPEFRIVDGLCEGNQQRILGTTAFNFSYLYRYAP